MGKLIYLIIAALVTAADLFGATMTLRSRRPHTIHFALALYGAALAEVSYTQTILLKNPFLAKLSFACFFSCIPVMLLFLQMYLINYTGMKLTGMIRSFLILEWVLAAVDVVCQFINPFREIVMGFTYEASNTAPWDFYPTTLYNIHLGFCYFIIAAIIVFLTRKVLSTPYVYRQKYYLIFAAMFFAVAINAVCLVLQNAGVPDYSQISYSVLGCIIYIDTFHNAQSGMLTRTRQVILDELGHPLVLFGEDNRVAARNKAAEFLIPGWKTGLEYQMSEFLSRWGFAPELEKATETASFQWNCQKDDRSIVYRVDVHILLDKKQLVIGRLFEFTDMSLGVDILTGFDSHNAFLRYSETRDAEELAPYCAAVLDINNLAEINRLHGNETGDLCISRLAKEIRSAFPRNCYFARPMEANLLVIAPGLSIRQAREAIERIRAACRQENESVPAFDIQYAVVSSSDAPSLREAWETAAFSMKSKKMLDKSSAHSSLMDSMVQTLMEADETTNEHVERTRKLGEQLGIRLGFSDLQLSDLSLLCLLHDIGKLGIPMEILNKPGKLSKYEWEIMKSHAEKGYRIALASPELSRIADYIRCHHECWNGKGYPDGLKQESIPLLSRVISIVDAYDAMTNDRPYHRAMSPAEARAELLRCAGEQFDPFLATEFVRMLEEAQAQEVSLPEPGIPKPKEAHQEPAVYPYTAPFTACEYEISLDDVIISIDDVFTQITGYTQQDIETARVTQWDLIPENDLPDYRKSLAILVENESQVCMEHRIRRKDGTIRFVLCIGQTIRSKEPGFDFTRIHLIDLESTLAMGEARRSAMDSAQRILTHWDSALRKDSLTGLFNHEAFVNEVESTLLDRGPYGLFLMLDMDNFKNINDAFGHSKGDKVLRFLADSLNRRVSRAGFCGRMGGDEFAAYIPLDDTELGTAGTKELTEGLFKSLTEDLKGYDSSLSISLGAAVCRADRNSFKTLYEAADMAMYQAKDRGKNCFCIEA